MKCSADSILVLCADDVVNAPNQGDSQVGCGNLKKFLQTAWAHFDESVSNIKLLTNKDESNIASEYNVKGTYYNTKPNLFPAKNQQYDITCWAFFKIKDGKIQRIIRHCNAKKWLDIVNPAA